MKLTGETEGLALVLDTAPLKARRWSRLKVSPARCAASTEEDINSITPQAHGHRVRGCYCQHCHPHLTTSGG